MLFDFVEKGVSFSVKLEAVKKKTSSCFYTRFFFISNLGFCLELRLLNSETETGTGVA